MISLFFIFLQSWSHPSHATCIVLTFVFNVLASLSILLGRERFQNWILKSSFRNLNQLIYPSLQENIISKEYILSSFKMRYPASSSQWVSLHCSFNTLSLLMERNKWKFGSPGWKTQWFRSPKAKRSRRKHLTLWTKQKKRVREGLR